jgi:DNA primase
MRSSSARFSSFERAEIVEKAQQCLWTDQGRLGLDYLRVERKLSDETIKKFSLGYIPESVRHNNPNVPQQSGRIIMPLYDPSGHLIVVTSRKIREDADGPKYWHETYEKSFYLYGLNLAKDTIRKWRFAILVEGQLDVMQMHNNGWGNTVGVCSTNLSEIQIAMAHRYCDEFVLMFDQDPNMAVQRGIDKIMPLTRHAPEMQDGNRSGGHCQTLAKCGFKFASIALDGGRNPDGSMKKTDPDEFLRSRGDGVLRPIIRDAVKKMRQEIVLEHQYNQGS